MDYLLAEENVGMAKFVSIGNKLDLDETDFLEYLDRDPETALICMYLESMSSGNRLIFRSIGANLVVEAGRGIFDATTTGNTERL